MSLDFTQVSITKVFSIENNLPLLKYNLKRFQILCNEPMNIEFLDFAAATSSMPLSEVFYRSGAIYIC